MINGLCETHLVISEKNPFLMVNFMYSPWNFFKMEKNKSPHEVARSHNEKVTTSIRLSRGEHAPGV